jgi:hypothetical protein
MGILALPAKKILTSIGKSQFQRRIFHRGKFREGYRLQAATPGRLERSNRPVDPSGRIAKTLVVPGFVEDVGKTDQPAQGIHSLIPR